MTVASTAHHTWIRGSLATVAEGPGAGARIAACIPTGLGHDDIGRLVTALRGAS